MKLTGAEIITRLLERQGVATIAGIPGGANLPLYDALYRSSIRHVLARHEQGAGFIAQGIARVTGRPAVCLGTSGPGAALRSGGHRPCRRRVELPQELELEPAGFIKPIANMVVEILL